MSHDVFSGEAKQRAPYKDTLTLVLAGTCLCLMLTALPGTPAAAQARTIEDCEKIQAADAYNQCLASFGPVAHERGVTADPEGSSKGGAAASNASVPSPHASSARSYRHGRSYGQHSSRHTGHGDPWAHMRRSNGRHRAEFHVRSR